jgi:Rrf2 family protein
MKLSTKGRYAARAVLELALEYGNGPIMLRKIACKQEISVRYLERMMAQLAHTGLVRSTRGQHGGFSLAKSPAEIKLSEVVQAVEGPITPVSCVEDPQLCNRNKLCVTRDIWTQLQIAMLDVLDSFTIADMVELQKYKESSLEDSCNEH